MSRFNARNTAGTLALALGGLVVSSASFAAQPLVQGYMAAASHAAAEGKCGEGKCGATDAKASAAKASAAKAPSKTAEGKCGEGKCGDETFAHTDSDDDGRVSRAELDAIAPGVDFSKVDRDGDGFISEMEAYKNLKAIFESNGKSIPAGLFAKFK